MREAHAELGGLDIMVNNPVMVAAGPFEKHTKDEIDYTVLGSLTMMMYGAHAALEFLLPQVSGKIINIGSVGGRIQQRGLVVYNACKSGVIGFTRNLAHEVAPRGVNVLGVAPGIMVKPDMKQYMLDPQNDQQRGARGHRRVHHSAGSARACVVARGGRQHGRLSGVRSRQLPVRPDDRCRRRTVDELMPDAPDVSEVLRRAIAQTGLDDFGDDSFREGLAILLTSLRDEAASTPAARRSSISASCHTSASGCRWRTGTAAIPRSTTFRSPRR